MARKKPYDLELPVILDYEKRPPSFWERVQNTTFDDFWDWCGGWPTVLIVLGVLIGIAGMVLTSSHYYLARSIVKLGATLMMIGLATRVRYGPY